MVQGVGLGLTAGYVVGLQGHVRSSSGYKRDHICRKPIMASRFGLNAWIDGSGV